MLCILIFFAGQYWGKGAYRCSFLSTTEKQPALKQLLGDFLREGQAHQILQAESKTCPPTSEHCWHDTALLIGKIKDSADGILRPESTDRMPQTKLFKVFSAVSFFNETSKKKVPSALDRPHMLPFVREEVAVFNNIWVMLGTHCTDSLHHQHSPLSQPLSAKLHNCTLFNRYLYSNFLHSYC